MTLPERDAGVAARWLEHHAGLWAGQDRVRRYLRSFGLTHMQCHRAFVALRRRSDVISQHIGWRWEYRWVGP